MREVLPRWWLLWLPWSGTPGSGERAVSPLRPSGLRRSPQRGWGSPQPCPQTWWGPAGPVRRSPGTPTAWGCGAPASTAETQPMVRPYCWSLGQCTNNSLSMTCISKSLSFSGLYIVSREFQFITLRMFIQACTWHLHKPWLIRYRMKDKTLIYS